MLMCCIDTRSFFICHKLIVGKMRIHKMFPHFFVVRNKTIITFAEPFRYWGGITI